MEDIMIYEDDLLTLWSTNMVSGFLENISSYVSSFDHLACNNISLNMKVGVSLKSFVILLKRFP